MDKGWPVTYDTILESSYLMMSGKVISRYRVLEKLGSGSMGEVYAAEDTKLGRRVALRFLPEEAAGDPVALEHSKHDALAAAALSHPHICAIYGFDEYEGKPFVVMELLEGETLRQLLAWQTSKRETKSASVSAGEETGKAHLGGKGAARLPVDILVELAIQIANALDAAHFRGILHRDIKPSNIFITLDGQAKIMDFGLAKITGWDPRRPETHPGAAGRADQIPSGDSGAKTQGLGGVALDIQSPVPADPNLLSGSPAAVSTVAYLSPEQVRGEDLDTRTDLFSFGAVLYETATGRQAFTGKRSDQILDAILHNTPPSVADVDRRLPQRLGAIIGKLMERDRELRYPSAMEARTDLKRLKREINPASSRDARHVTTRSAGRTRRVSSRRRTRARFLPRLAKVSLTLVGIAALLAGVFIFVRGRLRGPGAVPVKLTQISHWNKPINEARLSPDGNTVAFSSPVNGVEQVFMMLASGGDPMQLTGDPGDKYVDGFAPDSREIYYGGVRGREEEWGVPTFGGSPHRIATGRWLAASPDGDSLYFLEPGSRALIHTVKSGPGEEMVHFFRDPPLVPWSILPFPDGHNLLVTAVERPGDDQIHLYEVNVPTHQTDERGVLSGAPTGAAWADPGSNLVFSRTVSGFTNLWKFDWDNHNLTQITSGPGPDSSPMPYPAGNGMYFVQGHGPGNLTLYRGMTKQSVDIASANISRPIISPNGKRVAYIKYPEPGQSELWESEAEGSNPHKLASSGNLDTGVWSHDSAHIFFINTTGGVRKGFIVGADGRGPRPIASPADPLLSAVWSADDQSLYLSGDHDGLQTSLWKAPADGSPTQKLMTGCGIALDAARDGQFLLSVVPAGDNMGIYQIALAARQCSLLRPGVATTSARIDAEGKSFLYPVATHSAVTFYRQGWSEGRLVGEPAAVLELPFPFGMFYPGNTYDFTPDLSSIVYARPSRQADLYFLTPAP